MRPDNEYIVEDRISMRDVVFRAKSWFVFLLSKWRLIVFGTAVFMTANISYELISDPVYTAETTFILDGGDAFGSQLMSFTSLVGMDVNGMGGGSMLFDTDHIVELYMSNTMLKNAFLTSVDLGIGEERLITRYGKQSKQLKKWRSEHKMENFTFELPTDEMNVKHDSILFEVFDDFREKQYAVDRPDRKLDILSVRINSKDPKFAKAINEVLVRNVNEFYKETRTKKSSENVRILQFQVDSVRKKLDETFVEFEEVSYNQPYLNPAYRRSIVESQKLQIDLEVSAAVYEELVKNLEIAKASHRNNQPLIQVIDKPVFPLPDDKFSMLKLIVYSGFIGGVLAVGCLTLLLLYQAILSED